MKYLLIIFFISCALKRQDDVIPVIITSEEACRRDTQEMIDRMREHSKRIDGFVKLRDSVKAMKWKLPSEQMEMQRAIVQYWAYEDSIQRIILVSKLDAGRNWNRLTVLYNEIRAGSNKIYR